MAQRTHIKFHSYELMAHYSQKINWSVALVSRGEVLAMSLLEETH